MKTIFFIAHCLLLIFFLEIRYSAAHGKNQLVGPALEAVRHEIQKLVRRDNYKGADPTADSWRCYDFSSITPDSRKTERSAPKVVMYPDFCGVVTIDLVEIATGYGYAGKFHVPGNEQLFGPRSEVLNKCTTNVTKLLKLVVDRKMEPYGFRIGPIKVCGCDTDLCNK